MSNSHRGRLLAAIFSAGCLGLAAPAGAETLADAIALAYQNNPTLQAQRATQRALDEINVQARTGWRLTLNLALSATYSETRTPLAARGGLIDRNGDGIPDNVAAGILETNNSRLGLTFNQPLWTGGRVAAAVTAANADILAGRENLRRVEAQVLTSVVQAYVDVRRDQEILRIRQENVSVLGRAFEEANARFDVGEVTKTDVALSQSRRAQAQASLQQAQALLAISRAAYAALVGQNPADLAPEPPLGFLMPGDPDQAYAVAEKNNPQLRAQEFVEQASRARIAGARAERMPAVSAQATYGFNGPAIPNRPAEVLQNDLYSRSVTGAVNVTVPLFSGGLVTSRVRQAVERNNADKITVEGVRRSVLQGVTQFWSQMLAARANLASGGEQVRAATIAAEGTRQEQQVGLRTTLDVLNAEQELRTAQLNEVVARRDEYVAAANVLATMGRLEARNLIPTTSAYDPAGNYRALKMSWGWVPWEQPIGALDRVATPWPAPPATERPVEAPIAPGLQPPPTVGHATR